MLPLSSEAFSPELSKIISVATGKLYGLVTDIEERMPDRRAGGIRIAQAIMPPPSYFRANTYSSVSTATVGTGAAFSREAACWSAIGEALERYCASIYDAEMLAQGAVPDLVGPSLDLSKLIQCGRTDTHAFEAHEVRRWVQGHSLVSGAPLWVPAAMCYLGYEKMSAREIIAQNDSTGLAFSHSVTDAAMRALCEVVERDVFASSWLLKRSPQVIEFNPDVLPGLDISVLRALHGGSPELTLAYMDSVCGIHVVMGMTKGPGGHGVVAAAASISPVKAVEKAAAEALHGWHFARTLDVKRLELHDLKRPSDHLHYYLPPDRFQHVERFFMAGGTIPFSDLLNRVEPSANLMTVASAFGREGFEPTVIDLTTPDIASLGYHVVRVVVPGLQPLIFGADCRSVPDPRRLAHWRRVWGITDDDVNILPHPFP